MNRIPGLSIIFVITVLLFNYGCGEPEQGEAVNDSEDDPLGLPDLFEDDSVSGKPVAEADVDIIWEEYLPYGRKVTDLTWPQALVKSDSGLYLVGTRAEGDIVKRNTVDKKRCELVFYKFDKSGVTEIASFPSRSWERLYTGVTGDGERIYILGGAYTPPPIDLVPEGEFAYAGLSAVVGDVDVFDPVSGKLEPYGTLPVPKSGVSALFADGNLFACGGFYDTSKAGDELN
ncbi:MAG: hypothetical protein GY771_01775, partial [bacterium]|nr:hypothetical protein [bacterium]